MSCKKLLFVGFGDIASRAAPLFAGQSGDPGVTVTGLARSERRVPPGVNYWRGAVADSAILQQLARAIFDVVVVTLTPDRRQPEDYQRAYVDNGRRLVELWENAPQKPGLIIYTSSSSVYHQQNGEWVDENSPTEPQSPQAQRLLEAERLWHDSALNTVVVRFAGIYGPGRDQLQRQVIAGKGGPRENSPYTNRIHVDDCAGVIHHLVQRYLHHQPLAPLYLAADSAPAPSREVRKFLAERMGYPPEHLQDSPASARGGNKRCSNRLLRESGYEFRFPDYRVGYGDILSKS